MHVDVAERLEKSRSYEPCARAILGLCFFRRATPRVDQVQHGDLVFEVDRGIVGVRVQQAKYHSKHGDHATFRTCTQSGFETEWRKIQAGEGPDFFLSAFRHEHTKPDQRIGRWLLLDLAPFSGARIRKYGPYWNRDGSGLYRVQATDFPNGSLIESGLFLAVDP